MKRRNANANLHEVFEKVNSPQEFDRKVKEEIPEIGSKGAYLSVLDYNTDIFLKTANYSTPNRVFLTVEDVEDLGSDYVKKSFEGWKEGWHTKNLAIRTCPTLSMPGILKSYLNVSPDEIEKYVNEIMMDWNRPVAKLWRKKQCPDAKLAIMVMEMADTEGGGAGVYFSHDPVTGKRSNVDKAYSDWSPHVEFTVAGKKSNRYEDLDYFVRRTMTMFVDEAVKIIGKPIDVEFAFNRSGHVSILQVRPEVMCPEAKVKAYLEMMESGEILPEDVDITREELDVAIRITETKEETPYVGKPASSGVAHGKLGEDILIISEMTLENENLADGKVAIISSEGAGTCHSAVRARMLGIPCIVGYDFKETTYEGVKGYMLLTNYNAMVVSSRSLMEKYPGVKITHGSSMGGSEHHWRHATFVPHGTEITVDGTSGKIHIGHVKIYESEFSYAGRVLGSKLGLL